MPRAYIVCGSPAAGKSTYAIELAKKKRAALLDIDTCTERVIQAALKSQGLDVDDRDSPYYKKTFRNAVYETLFAIARENVVWIDTVVVGPFTKEIQDSNWPSFLKRHLNAEIEVHFVACAADERRRRMERRANPRDIQKLQNWGDHVRYIGEGSAPVFEHVRIDTSN